MKSNEGLEGTKNFRKRDIKLKAHKSILVIMTKLLLDLYGIEVVFGNNEFSIHQLTDLLRDIECVGDKGKMLIILKGVVNLKIKD